MFCLLTGIEIISPSPVQLMVFLKSKNIEQEIHKISKVDRKKVTVRF